MIIGSITITSLDPIGNAVAGDTLIPVVNMDGVPTTQKMTVANLMQAGVGANLGPVANVTITGGTNGYVLQTDGAGNLSWTAQTGGGGNGSVGGANTQVQFNDSGAFAGNSGFTFNKTAGALASPMIDTAAVYHLAGTIIENADLAHGATSALIIPANGNSTNPAQLNNYYGNVVITSGTDADHTKNWTFGSDGNLTNPGNLSVVGNANIGNIGTAGVVTATGNVRGGNLNTAGIVSATGAIRGASLYVSGTGTAINASSGNILTNEVTGTKFNFLNGSYTATITGGGATSNYSLNLPADAGTDGQVLTTDGTGNLSWSAGGGGGNTFSAITMSSTPSGPSNQINYGTGNLVVWNDGGWALGVYNGTDYGTEGMRLSPGIEGNVEVILPANQDAPNNSLQLNNYAGNVQVNANNHYWTFDKTGNLVIPSSTTKILYPDGQPYTTSKIVNGNSYTNIEFPNGNVTIGASVQTVTGAWINTYGEIIVNDSHDTEGSSVIIDTDGNVYVTGALNNPDFSANQAYIRKLSSSGQVLWQKALPQTVNDSQFTSGESLALGPDGNVYWLTNIWYDDGGNVFPMVSKVDSSTGESVWTTQLGNEYYGYDIAVNSASEVFVVTNVGGRITKLNSNGTVAWGVDPSNGGISIVDTGTYVIIGYGNGTVGAYGYDGILQWTNQVFDTGSEVWGLAWDGTDWYAADVNGYIMKISGADNSTILWQKHINRNGTGGNMFLTWMEYADGYIYATGTGNDGSGDNGIITVKINSNSGALVWARSLEAAGIGQWYWYGHHDLSVHGSYYAITGQAYPYVGANNTKQVLAQLPTDGTLDGSTVGPYKYVNVPSLTIDDTDVGGAGYSTPAQPSVHGVTYNYTLANLVAPYNEINILSPFIEGGQWTFDNNANLTTPTGLTIGSTPAPFLATMIHQANGALFVSATGNVDSFAQYGWTENLFSPGNSAVISFNNDSDGAASIVVHNNSTNTDYNWKFDQTGAITIPTATGPGLAGFIKSANSYPTLLAYGANEHGGPELDWMNSDDPANAFSNSSVLRHTMYLNDGGLYVGFNENEVVSVPTVHWNFNPDGSTLFPTLTTQRGDNPSGTISGQTLLFADNTQEAVISTPDGISGNEYSQRLVINPGQGYNYGEGGDIYLWAGRGGDGSGSGGDIKIRGGQGGANTQGGNGGDGGYIRIEAGDAAATGGAPGYIDITGGVAGYVTPGITGGAVTITGGQGQNGNGGITTIQGGYGGTGYHGGNVQINGGGTSSGSASEGNVNIQTGGNTWIFDPSGNLTLPRGGIIHETNIPFGGLAGNTIALLPSGGTNADQQLLIYPTAGSDNNHIHLTSGNLYNTELFLGDDNLYVKLANTGNIIINANDSVGNSAQWSFNTNGSILTTDELTLDVPGGIPNSVTAIIYTTGGWESNPTSDLATTGGSGTGLTVDIGYDGGYASSIAIHTPGTGYSNGDTITVTSGSSTAIFTINVASNQWTFGTDGNLTLPTISLGTGVDEQTIIQSQRKIIPANRYSAVISGSTPTLVYTASSSSISSLKMTISVEHSGLGSELFDVSAIAAGANVMYSVSNRLNGTGQPDTTVSVDYFGGGPVSLAVTLTVNSGATTSWVTYDSTEFGYQVD